MNYEYKFYLDTGRDNTFSGGLDNITNFVEFASWTLGHSSPWSVMADRAVLSLTINNASGKFSQSDTGAAYYNLLRKGTLAKVVIHYSGADTTMCVLKLDNYRPISNVQYGDEFQYQLEFVDVTPMLLEQSPEIPLQENVRVDEALTGMMESTPFIYPYESAWFFIGEDSIGGTKNIYDYTTQNLTDFEEAYSVIPFVGDNLNRGNGTNLNQYIGDLMLTERTGLFFWNARTEAFTFYHRYHNKIAVKSPYSARTSSATFTMAEISRIQKVARMVVNNMTVNYSPREVGVPQSVISIKRNLPLTFRAKDLKTFTLRFEDINGDNAQVGAKDVIPTNVGLDIIANSEPDGSGEDWTRFVILKDFRAFADRAEITIFNRKVGDPAYITTFQVRGTPISTYQREEVIVTNSESRYSYDLQSRTDTARLIADEITASEYGRFWTNTFKDSTQDISNITITITDNSPAWLKQQVINRTIGDVITIVDSSNNNSDYIIVGEGHSPTISNGHRHDVTYSLRPVSNNLPFIIDESNIGGIDLIVA